jgi:tRNA_anti-like
MGQNPKNKKALKWLLIGAGALLLIGAAAYFYFATLTHDDTASLKADFKVEAISFIKEFEKDYKAANKKYAEKIIAVKGIVTETEPADTTMNIKMTDTTTGSYLIFAFQNNDMTKAKKIKAGDNVTIKGSCSDGIYSDILGTYFVSFKRSTIEK